MRMRGYRLALPFALVACGSSGSPGAEPPGGTATKEPETTSVGAGRDAGAGGGSATGLPVPDGGLAACEAAWTPTCRMLLQCDASLTAALFGDAKDCVTKMASSCAASIYVPGGLTVEDEKACAASLSFATCDDFWRFWFSGEGFPACSKHGSRGPSSACSTGAQCASGFCARGATDACGVCADRLAENASCDGTVPCGAGLVCAGTCRKPGGVGAACNEAAPCDAWLRCLGGACAKPTADGAPCDPSVPQPACDVDHFCNVKSKICQPLGVVDAGQACGVVDDGSYAGCKVGSVCRLEAGVPKGTCIAASVEGEACSVQASFLFGLGPCAYPLNCIDGQCRRGDPVDCR